MRRYAVALLLGAASGCGGERGTGPPPPGTHAGYYVTPGGSSSGTGTSAQPWDLATALAGGGGTVQPGDTVWLRGGTYHGAFASSLTGTAAAPIVVRQYPGERAIVDGNGYSGSTIAIDGAWAIYWGFEVMNSNTNRAAFRPTSIYVRYASHVKVVNVIVHDGGGAMYTEPSATDVEIYGCIIYNNGWDSATRSNGHAIYIKSDVGPRLIRANVMFNQFGLGIHAYSDFGSGGLANITVDSNVAFNSGALSVFNSSNLLVGGQEPVTGAVVRGNMTYFSPGEGGYNVRFGYDTTSNGTITAANNYIAGGADALEVRRWQTATLSGNTIYGPGTVAILVDPTLSGHTWSGNQYYRNPGATAWQYAGTAYTFSGWQAQTGLGGTDQATNTAPPGPQIFVLPNQYEPGRGTIVVYNWGGLGTVPVNPVGVLQSGDAYEVRNVQALLGSPVASGTYASGTINVPMAGVSPPAPVGTTPNTAPMTGPQFNVFILTRTPS